MRYLLLTFLLLTGCGIFPEKVSMDDPRIQPLIKAAAQFERGRYGFTPLPTKAEVHWEAKPTKNYDTMLHIYSKTSRTVAFKKTPTGYKWIGEQETFRGPKQYKSPDGTLYEQIVLTYETEPVSGYPVNKLNITYFGEDSRLAKYNITLDDIRPILKEWKY